MTPEQERLLKRIDKKLTAILSKGIVSEEEESGTWVTANKITRMTGWTNNDMQQARKNKWVKYRRIDTGGFRYMLESVNERFIKKIG